MQLGTTSPAGVGSRARRGGSAAVLVAALVAALLPGVAQPPPAQAHASCTVPVTQTIRGISVIFDQCYDRPFTHSGQNWRIHVYYRETANATNTQQCTNASPALPANRCEHELADVDDANGDNVNAVAMGAEAELAVRFYLDQNLTFVPSGNEVNVYIAEDPRLGGIPDSFSIQIDDDSIDNNDQINKRILAFHEMHHLVQIQNWGSVGWQGFYGEGMSRAVEDRFDPAVDADIGHLFIPRVQNILSSNGVRSADLITQDYPSALWWTWALDQYRQPADVDPVTGWQAIRNFYAALAAAPTQLTATTNWVAGEGESFYEAFRDYTLAMWAYRFDPPDPRLDFLDAEINTNGGQLSGHTVVSGGPAFGTVSPSVNPRSSQYIEFNPASQCDFTAFSFDANGIPMSFSVMTADAGAWQGGWTATTSGTWARTVRSVDYDRVVGVITGRDSAGTASVGRGCVTPGITIKSPTTSAFEMVGTADNPRKFITRVRVSGQDGSPVAGLTASAFTVEVRPTGSADLIPATVVNAAYVQDDYWLLVQAPDGAAGAQTGAFHDLRVSIGGAADTENSSLLYVERASDVLVVMDRSGSMAASNKIAAARNAANLLVNQLQGSDQGGYVAFDHDTYHRQHLAPVTPAHRAALEQSIADETPGGATSIGGGLQRAATDHDAHRDTDHPCAFVLLSDGQENADPRWDTVRPDVVNNACAIHAVAFGPQANEPLMQQIAAAVPGGSYDYADDTGGASLGPLARPMSHDSGSGFVGWENNLARVYDYKSALIAGRQRAFSTVGGSTASTGCSDTSEVPVDFEDVPVGTQVGVGEGFVSRGVPVTGEPFVFATGGSTNEGVAFVDGQGMAGGSGNDVATNNVNLDFGFGGQVCQVRLRFGDFGGSENLEVNGDRRAGELFQLDGQAVGGASVNVTRVSDTLGVLVVTGAIRSFSVGGQEFWLDDVVYRRPPSPPPSDFHVDDQADQLVLSVAWQNPEPGSHQVILTDPDGNVVPEAGHRRLAPVGTNEVWTVPDPAPGEWTVKVSGLDQEHLVTVQLRSHYELHLFTGTPVGDLSAGVRVPIVASLAGADGPVAGADVRAVVTTPTTGDFPLPLYDDGAHGDAEPGDGVYGNWFDATGTGDTTVEQPEEGAAPAVVGSYLVDAVATFGDVRREAQTSFALSGGPDRDADGLPDRWEVLHGLDPLVPDADDDPDRDRLPNWCELDVGTHPRNADTDRGGEADGSEVTTPTTVRRCTLGERNPLDPVDDRIGRVPFLTAVPELDVDGAPFVDLQWDLPFPRPDEPVVFDVFRRCRTDGRFGPWTLIADDLTSPFHSDSDVTVGQSCEYDVDIAGPDGVVGDAPTTQAVDVTADPYAPTGEILVDGGAPTTQDLTVDLQISADDTGEAHDPGQPPAPAGTAVAELMMRLGNTADLSGEPWQPYRAQVQGWDLGDVPPGGMATVFVEFMDAAGNATGAPRYDTIFYVGDTRLSGPTRIETAIDISRAGFGDDEAEIVVLARADEFADALSGTPFAVTRGGPMLLTGTNQLHAAARAELQRVLPAGRTVYLLGGSAALSQQVEAAVAALGYDTQRLSGPSRVETAVAIAQEVGDPDPLLITTGFDFPDALAAGAAAARHGGAVLLTQSERRHPATDAYLSGRQGATVYAVGGPAARPYSDRTTVFGPTREDTAIAVAERFFEAPQAVGIARRDQFADALTGGVHIGRRGGPMLLTPTNTLHPAVDAYLCAQAESLVVPFVYGGTAAVNEAVATAVAERIANPACPG